MKQYYLLDKNKNAIHVSMSYDETKNKYLPKFADAVYIGCREITENNITVIETIKR